MPTRPLLLFLPRTEEAWERAAFYFGIDFTFKVSGFLKGTVCTQGVCRTLAGSSSFLLALPPTPDLCPCKPLSCFLGTSQGNPSSQDHSIRNPVARSRTAQSSYCRDKHTLFDSDYTHIQTAHKPKRCSEGKGMCGEAKPHDSRLIRPAWQEERTNSCQPSSDLISHTLTQAHPSSHPHPHIHTQNK